MNTDEQDDIYDSGTFHLTISLGNDAMCTGHDVAAGLRQVAESVDSDGFRSGGVRDLNGNLVGEWGKNDAAYLPEPSSTSLTATLERRAELAEKQADTLADALDRFFYDMRFTAPEAISMRFNQLGERITETMTALGYPKKGVPAKPGAGQEG